MKTVMSLSENGSGAHTLSLRLDVRGTLFKAADGHRANADKNADAHPLVQTEAIVEVVATFVIHPSAGAWMPKMVNVIGRASTAAR